MFCFFLLEVFKIQKKIGDYVRKEYSFEFYLDSFSESVMNIFKDNKKKIMEGEL